MSYEVVLTDSFLKEVKKLGNKGFEEQLFNKIKELEQSPERNKRLKYDLKNYYGLRIGKLRVLYTIKDNIVYVEVLVKGHKYREV